MCREEICLNFPGYIKKEAPSLTCKVTVKEREETKAVWLRGKTVPAQPLFGPQTHLDPHKGVSFTAGVSGVKKLLAIYQHKELS